MKNASSSRARAAGTTVAHADIDYDALVRAARFERSLAIGNAIAGVVGLVSHGVERAFALIAHGGSAGWIGHAVRRHGGARR